MLTGIIEVEELLLSERLRRHHLNILVSNGLVVSLRKLVNIVVSLY